MKIKKILLILSLIMAILTIWQINSTYAIFYSEAKAQISQKLGKWNITVNNTDIVSAVTKEFTINEIKLIENTSTLQNKIAPGTQGYFDIQINVNDTDVSTKYEMEIDETSLKESNIHIKNVQELQQDKKIDKTEDNKYIGIILLKDIKSGKSTHTLRIAFAWENDEKGNEADTQIGTKLNSKVKIPVKITVSQYLGEN